MKKTRKSLHSTTLEREKLHFEVDSHLLLELGERLVARPSIALAELVKNSYDADSTSVTIHFLDVRNKGGTIILEDNGEGMTLLDVKTKWMRIGTDDKERNPISPKYKRTRTGRKGIGRFACRLISEKLILESVSKKDGGTEKIRGHFLWDELRSGRDVEDFEVEVSREVVAESTPTGTRLVLKGTRLPWSKEDLERFKKEILGLVNPFPWQSKEMPLSGFPRHDPGFKIQVEAPDYPHFEGLLSDDILRASWGRLEGTLDKDGVAIYNLTITPTGEQYDFRPSKRYTELGSASFTLYMFSLGKLTPKIPGITLSALRGLAREYGGVKVFLDGFRVFRYGEPGDDWLRLEFDRSRSLGRTPQELLGEAEGLKRPMLSIPGNNQLFGAVSVSRSENPKITPTVTRDRLLENPAFKQLREFVRLGIDWITVRYAAYRAKERKKEAEMRPKTDALSIINEIEKIIDEHSTEIGSNTTIALQQYVSMAKEDLIAQREESISQISMLRVLASTGTMISVFDHEISLAGRRLVEMASDLQKFLRLIPLDHQDRFRVLLANLRAWEMNVKRLAGMIGLMLGKDARVQKRALSIHKAVEKIFDPFRLYMEDNHIKTLNAVSEFSRTPPMYEAELQSILVNLMTNAIKALADVEEKRICVKVEDTEDSVSILFLDSGSGLPRERWEEVFEPFVSYSVPSLDFGVGTGLGLAIVNDIIESYGGKVRFIDPPKGWSTCVRIDLPKVEK